VLGQHTDEILSGVLKKNDAEIAKLKKEGVV
jgi:crotonobetainyl-CoA:carnitine CoA-transferase CaiB-like acyl-CoA transferase